MCHKRGANGGESDGFMTPDRGDAQRVKQAVSGPRRAPRQGNPASAYLQGLQVNANSTAVIATSTTDSALSQRQRTGGGFFSSQLAVCRYIVGLRPVDMMRLQNNDNVYTLSIVVWLNHRACQSGQPHNSHVKNQDPQSAHRAGLEETGEETGREGWPHAVQLGDPADPT